MNLNRLISFTFLFLLIALGAFRYGQFLNHPRSLWNGIAHDRNGHYEYGQHLGMALREANVFEFFSTLEKSNVWPPFHGLLLAISTAIVGPDYRLAVLPSLIGWLGTAFLGFLLARKFSPLAGNWAGVLAAAFILASPAYQGYALDVMLESLGSCLTLLVVYLYARAARQPSATWTKWLAIAMTLLFFEKYNYYVLAALSLLAAHLTSNATAYLQQGRQWFGKVSWYRLALNESRSPLTWAASLCILTACLINYFQPVPVRFGGHDISVYPPENLITASYALIFSRIIQMVLKRPELWRSLGHSSQQFARWHVLPVMVSLLVPHRLPRLLWYLSPGNAGVTHPSLWQSIQDYVKWAANDYHPSAWQFWLCSALFLLAIFNLRRLEQGGKALCFLAVIGIFLTLIHPNQKSRYLHSWFASIWVAGGVSIPWLLDAWPGNRIKSLCRFVPCAILAALLVFLIPNWIRAARLDASGHQGETNSLLDISDEYLPYLARDGKYIAFSNQPAAGWVLWTYRDYFKQLEGIFWLKDPYLSREDKSVSSDAVFGPATSNADGLILIEFLPESRFYSAALENPAFSLLLHSLQATNKFRKLQEIRLQELGCRVLIVSRNPT